jgi:HD superfamily phosphohydrolase
VNKLKIINDPIYGFITIPTTLIFDIIEHPYFQRLRRISQMGLSYLVYPGANHTRFQHALGAMFLMGKAVNVLKSKGISISKEEEEAVLIAILLHDIGHGAFSHALEHAIVPDVSHEEISLLFMEDLNDFFGGKLTLAIALFKGDYHKPFLHELISSQLDMDRMDYLKRDSFYTGVVEGNINSERLISMINVKDGHVVVEEKGIYSVEKFLMARRLMYWQVYLHKTGLVAERLLVKVLQRAKELTLMNRALGVSDNFDYFLRNTIDLKQFNAENLNTFSRLDDYDIIGAIKDWTLHDDFILAYLSNAIINRKLPKISIENEPISTQRIAVLKQQILADYPVKESELHYIIDSGSIGNQVYSKTDSPILIYHKDGTIHNLSDSSEQLNFDSLHYNNKKYYLFYPKELKG